MPTVVGKRRTVVEKVRAEVEKKKTVVVVAARGGGGEGGWVMLAKQLLG